MLRMKIQTSRMMDHLAAKSVYFLSVAYERKGLIACPQFRVMLFDILRECVLHHNYIGQATLMNIIIRSFLSQNLFEQARSFISKTTFPEAVSNNQFARYLYYTGRIKAVQMEYSEALG